VLDRSAAKGDLLQGVAAAVAGGVDWLQVRERGLDGAELLAFAEAAAGAARDAAARAGHALQVIVNRRSDVALAIGAEGVHLGFDAVGTEVARQLLGPDALLGVSCHAPEEVHAAAGASYAHLAPIFPPLSKAASRPALGLGALRAAAGTRPVLAQGGVEASNAGACLEAGAAGIAVTGAVLMADDPGAAAAALRAALDAATSHPGTGAPKR
jgi:thiamine-phosphate diphosphorylase